LQTDFEKYIEDWMKFFTILFILMTIQRLVSSQYIFSASYNGTSCVPLSDSIGLVSLTTPGGPAAPFQVEFNGNDIWIYPGAFSVDMMSVYYCNNFTESYAFIYSGTISGAGSIFKVIMWHNENQTILQQDCGQGCIIDCGVPCGGPFEYGTFEYMYTTAPAVL